MPFQGTQQQNSIKYPLDKQKKILCSKNSQRPEVSWEEYLLGMDALNTKQEKE